MRRRALEAHFLLGRANADARRVTTHEHLAQASASSGPIGSYQQDHDIRYRGVCHPHFAAVDDPRVTFLDRRRTHAPLKVRASPRLCQRQACQLTLPCGQRRQPLRLLLLTAITNDGSQCQPVVCRNGQRCRSASPAQFLNSDGRADRVDGGAAILLRHLKAEQA